MDINLLLRSPLLGLISTFVPQAAPLINFIQAHQDTIARAAPVLQAAIDEGRPAFDAAVKQAPQLAAALQGFLQKHDIPGSPAGVPAPKVALENATRLLAGAGKLTPEQEKAMAANDPISKDSKSGSG